ncbi:hypothetical protein ACKVV1_011158 [Pyricularia oryzae]
MNFMIAAVSFVEREALSAARLTRYESGEVPQRLRSAKEAFWAARHAAGLDDPTRYTSFARAAAPVPCADGLAAVVPGSANDTFRCSNVDFYDFVSHADLGSAQGRGASSWGWTSDDGREFVAIAQSDGAAFAELTSEGKLRYLGRLPQTPGSEPRIWREMKGYKHYLVIGSEAVNHGVQIFDFKKLLDVEPNNTKLFRQSDLTSHWNELPIGRSHNVVVNEEKEYAVAVGAAPRNDSCASGLIFIDLKDPSQPFSPGCAGGDGYVHDAQCIVYRGPDQKYNGRDICYGYNEDTLTMCKLYPPRMGDQQEYLVLDDELDEKDSQSGPNSQRKAVTYFWDIKSLERPRQTGVFRSNVTSIDHNQFVVGKYAFQSNYGAGLRVLDISSLPDDPTGEAVKEVAYFDIFPEDDHREGGGDVAFTGTWSSYPFFKSGFIVINTIERGAFVVKMTNREF